MLTKPSIRVLFAAVALVFSLLSGCKGECLTNLNYPGCEYRFEKTQLYVYDFESVPINTKELNIGTEAKLHLSGDSYLGTKWSVFADQDDVILGLPAIHTVVRLSLEDLSACPDWSLRDRAQDNDTLDLTITPTDRSCDANLNWEQWTELGAFGTSLSSIHSPTDEPLLWVGAPDTQNRRGKVSLYNTASEDKEPIGTWTGATNGNQWGNNIVSCGDISGDGFPDILLSSYAAFEHAGGIQLIRSEDFMFQAGEETPLTEATAWRGETSGDQAGVALWCQNDLNGDDYADILIGAPFDDACGSDPTITNCGVVYLISGGPTLQTFGRLPDIAERAFRGPASDALCGQTIVGADFNLDTKVDLVLGCPGIESGKGGALVYSGTTLNDPFSSATGFLTGRDSLASESGVDTKEHFGLSMLTGDLRKNGQSGLFLGSPTVTSQTGNLQSGVVEYWAGNNLSGLLTGRQPAQPNLRLQGTTPFHRVGNTLWMTDLLYITTLEN